MARIIILSLLALLAVFVVARSCGVTPGQVEERHILAQLNAEEGGRYQSENRRREGVVTLPSGVQVEMLRVGEGAVPSIDDVVLVHYEGRHLDGRIFDSSYRRGDPSAIAVERTIPGWRTVLVDLPVGSHVRLTIPPDQAYGTPGSGVIGPEETILFDLELLGIIAPESPEAHDPTQDRVPGLR
ncbi:FKBP-type peptidyl-prolyl cis-trans isomerase 1-like protein [Thioalkalivibrio sulfidiphilus HL-EbGr7]|uniref:Peptidyl-prolyl cis-trans isomerase n=1 Tax=Thioalkalivibrio sulfidiphilus (strain HL-EbGR7) TaxID=396588 RepID=B8GLZ7_THISH|nr:FKBP-type peptidyl-prolyl cis-trans isomerase [Thioalkalivibrio sulfidiphilus]ACL71750.1 FKBP-type peptidyl-prolyl cis-trans isomerase 1-like protein [Thioalkalivibrio sulfidiphilus HL-EbGr7]